MAADLIDGCEMALLVLFNGKYSACSLFRSTGTRSTLVISFTQMMVFKWPFIGDTGEGTLSIHYSEEIFNSKVSFESGLKWILLIALGKRLHLHHSDLLGERALWINTDILKSQATCDDSAGRDYAQLLLNSPRTQLFESVGFYVEDGLEIAINQWHWWRDSAHSLFTSPGRQSSSIW